MNPTSGGSASGLTPDHCRPNFASALPPNRVKPEVDPPGPTPMRRLTLQDPRP